MIELRHVVKRYGEATVVDDVSMVVEPRTVCAIVGTSGSGKTTLMRMINRMTEPSDGKILIDGEPNTKLPAHELRRRIGYVIQNHGLFPHRTVAENIAAVPKLLGWDRAKTAARVEELLHLFGLDPARFANRQPHELSGGQQQRVGVARALAAKPNILLMDEPFGALDPIIRNKAQADLLDIQRSTGTTVVIVTHDMEEAIHLGHRIAVMDGGKLLQYAPPAEILAKPATPFVEELIGSAERPFRFLSLGSLEGVVEPGEAAGAPIAAGTNRRDALAELLWSGRDSAPVADAEGRTIGRIRTASLVSGAARPAA
ncbi:ABC transporter ATP-binding protein [Aureimonas leprariae]|uniref:ABC transporter ATP-binding protein n=1 Tax=Plantimonas leprariae TaxID=2615207 RepID=A0A7V7PKI6_9HYPH|nr:ABC transporter ATP-binding protein [Aureimonas leprariae]KAB0676412.1 ABC transporter ATP-binding protein [Aureimonas leprariae]